MKMSLLHLVLALIALAEPATATKHGSKHKHEVKKAKSPPPTKPPSAGGATSLC